MKQTIKILSTALLLLGATAAHASTDCRGPISWIGSDVGNGYGYIQIGTGVTGMVAVSDSNYRMLMNSAFLAKIGGTDIFIRFAANGVSCTALTYRTDVTQIWNP